MESKISSWAVLACVLLLVGGVAPASAVFTGWHSEVLKNFGGGSSYYLSPSLAVDSAGKSHVSFYDYVNKDLIYGWQDTSAWQFYTVDSTGDVGQDSSIAVDTSRYPHIGYYDYTAKQLDYAWKDGTGWHIQVVDNVQYDFPDPSIALDGSGYPHISYCDRYHGELKHAWKNITGWHNETADTVKAYYSSIDIDSGGYPHISYYDNTYSGSADNNDLKYVWKDGSGWHAQTVDSTGDVGAHTSLALSSSDDPHISYYDGTTGNVKHAWNTGSGWNFEQVDTGSYTSIKLDTGNDPHISYGYAGTGHGLNYAFKNATGWHTREVDVSGYAYETSLALDSSKLLKIINPPPKEVRNFPCSRQFRKSLYLLLVGGGQVRLEGRERQLYGRIVSSLDCEVVLRLYARQHHRQDLHLGDER